MNVSAVMRTFVQKQHETIAIMALLYRLRTFGNAFAASLPICYNLIIDQSVSGRPAHENPSRSPLETPERSANR
jgi:hypothetical protein